MPRKILNIFVLMVMLPSASLALVLRGGSLGQGPVSMGQAGAVASAPVGVEGLLWNPASLAGLEGWSATALGGTGHLDGLYHTGFVLGLPLSDYGKFGIGMVDERFSGSADFRQNVAVVGGAIPINRSLWLASNQKFLTADPGGLAGWSMDLGLRSSIELPFTSGDQNHQIVVGVGLVDAVSALRWESGLDETQPLVTQVSASYVINDGSWISFQMDQMDGQESGSAQQWRVGGQASFFNKLVVLRAGSTQVEGGDLLVTAGLGSGFALGSVFTRVDYALVTAGDNLGDKARHLLSLSTALHIPRKENKPIAAITKLLKDPNNKIHNAKIGLAGISGEDVAEWELNITDNEGNTLRTFKGKGAMPVDLAWDGRDESGELVDADGLMYELRAQDKSGKARVQRSILSVATSDSEFGELTGMGDDDLGLRADVKKEGPLKVRPSLRSGQGYELAGADFDLSDVASEGVEEWELRVVDAQGKTVKTFSGRGNPPKSIQWEGTNDLGEPIEAGLGAGYVLRVMDEAGENKEFGSDLVQAEDFSKLITETVQQPAGPPAKVDCRRDIFGHGWICFISFDFANAKLSDNGYMQLSSIAGLIRQGHYVEVMVHGHADSVGDQARNLALSQARADSVMDALLVRYGIEPENIVARGMGSDFPLVSDSDVGGRNVNRRVELFIRPRLTD